MIISKNLSLAIAFALIISSIIYLESSKPGTAESQKEQPTTSQDANNAAILQKSQYPKAQEIQGTQGWINSEPLAIASLKGKVVLVDFWTYTCINCIRTLPYLKSWHEKYAGKGLVIIGVHTPEFDFEKKLENVQMAAAKYNLTYPIVQDNDYATWNAYQNRYWPHKYLIDKDGFVRYDHIGEGGYEQTEKKIQELLAEIGQNASGTELTEENQSYQLPTTPELYAGYKFARAPLGNAEGYKPGETVDYKLPATFQPSVIILEGLWKNNEDNLELVGDSGKIILVYRARHVNIVGRSMSNFSIEMGVLLNGTYVSHDKAGYDVHYFDGKAVVYVLEPRLYEILGSGNSYGQNTLELYVKKGFSFNSFTFGS